MSESIVTQLINHPRLSRRAKVYYPHAILTLGKDKGEYEYGDPELDPDIRQDFGSG